MLSAPNEQPMLIGTIRFLASDVVDLDGGGEAVEPPKCLREYMVSLYAKFPLVPPVYFAGNYQPIFLPYHSLLDALVSLLFFATCIFIWEAPGPKRLMKFLGTYVPGNFLVPPAPLHCHLVF